MAHLSITSSSRLPKTQSKHNHPLRYTNACTRKHTHTNVQAQTNTVLYFLDVSVHDSLATNPSVGWMSVSSSFIIRLICHPCHCFYIRLQSHWQLMALSLRLPYSLPFSFTLYPPPSLFVPFFFFLTPQCPTCFACMSDSGHVCGCSYTLLSHPPTSTSICSTDLFPPPPPLLRLSHLPRLHIPLHLSISLPCTIGTKVAPSERAIKRPYKKPQHREERVMMKFNCSSWYTWGLAQCVWICGYMRADVCTVHVFVCVQKAWGLGTEPELPC